MFAVAACGLSLPLAARNLSRTLLTACREEAEPSFSLQLTGPHHLDNNNNNNSPNNSKSNSTNNSNNNNDDDNNNIINSRGTTLASRLAASRNIERHFSAASSGTSLQSLQIYSK